MAQPQIKTDIEARVQDTGDTMTGTLLLSGRPQEKTVSLKLEGYGGTGYTQIYKNVSDTNDYGTQLIDIGNSGNHTRLIIRGQDITNLNQLGQFYTKDEINNIDNYYPLLHSGNVGSYALPIEGGTLLGPLTLLGNQWYETGRQYSLDLNNSDIVNANAIYFKDLSDTPTEGIHFYAGVNIWDTLWSQNGTLYYSPLRNIDDTAATSYRVITSAGGVVDGNLVINNVFSTRKESVISGTAAGTRSALVIYGSTYGNNTAHIKTPQRLTWGDPNPQIIFNYQDSTTSGQPLALMYSDNNDIGWGTTLALVSNESTCGFIAPYIRARTQFQVIRDDATPAKNTIMPIFNVKYQNGIGDYYSTDIISLVGTGNAENNFNASIMVGSKSGSLHLHAGECGNSMVSTLGLNDTEHIYMTCDGSIYQYVGCANDATSYTLAQTIASNKITAHVPLYGAVWNDYAEYRDQKEKIEPGYCAAAVNDGRLVKTSYRLQACDGIVSDTFGFAIGETEENRTPLAVSGRVLAYFEGNRENYQAGDAVGAGPNGKVIKMTREEIREYPDRIIGHVSEIPDYKRWGTGDVEVNDRIWIKVH